MVGIFLKNVFLGLLIFSVAAYHIVCYVTEHREYKQSKHAIISLVAAHPLKEFLFTHSPTSVDQGISIAKKAAIACTAAAVTIKLIKKLK